MCNERRECRPDYFFGVCVQVRATIVKVKNVTAMTVGELPKFSLMLFVKTTKMDNSGRLAG